MSRLVAFGCSYTFGDSLPDCVSAWHSPPSEYAWPAVLGKCLNLPSVNKGSSGAGNLEILWNILNFEFQPTDICIIMWSHFSRDHIFTPTELYRVNRYNKPDKLTKYWALTHTEFDLNVRNWIYIHHADCYLSSIGIKKAYHMKADEVIISDARPQFVNLANMLDFKFVNVDHGRDGSHPGVKSHEKLAKKLCAVIKG
jgi:hypothetical protein